MREIVIPGEELGDASKLRPGFGTYESGGKIISVLYGVFEKHRDSAKVVPLNGKYMPQMEDIIIGIVTSVKFAGCVLDINSPYTAFLRADEEYKEGDVVQVRVADVTEVNSVLCEDPKLLYSGKLIEVQPVKIPRIVGKKGSMLNVLRNGIKCMFFLGRNGRIFIKGTKSEIDKAEEVIELIQKEAHMAGLTEKVAIMLKGR